MAMPLIFQHVAARPSSFLASVEYDVAIGFIDGYDAATHGGVLVGLREWLIVKLGFGNNLIWSSLIQRLIFHEQSNANEVFPDPVKPELSIRKLFTILDEFATERDSANGLRSIYLRYHQWLQSQDWYDSESPDYVEDTP